MLKSNTTTDKYKLNQKTILTVKNVPHYDEQGKEFFRVELTLKHKAASDKPMTFDGPEDIAEFISGIDYDEEQQSLV